jgi:hypothetical protein
MTSAAQLAWKRLEGVFHSGITRQTIILNSSQVSRVGLTVWIMDTFAGDIDPRQEFCALLVGDQYTQLCMVRDRLEEARKMRTKRDAETKVAVDDSVVLEHPLPNFLFMTDRVFRTLSDDLPPQSVSLLILDERNMNTLRGLAAIVERLNPSLTLFITRQPIPKLSPWEKFGEPMEIGQREVEVPEVPLIPRRGRHR